MRGIISWFRRLALRALGIDLVIENCAPLPELFVEMRESQELAADRAAVENEIDNISRRFEELSKRAACAVKVEAAFLDATAQRKLIAVICKDLLAHLYGMLKGSRTEAKRRARMGTTRGRIDALASALSPDPPPTEPRVDVGETPEGEPCAASCDVVEARRLVGDGIDAELAAFRAEAVAAVGRIAAESDDKLDAEIDAVRTATGAPYPKPGDE